MAERLTLEDAITHAKEVAERNRKQYKNCPSDRTDISHQTCEECAEEHEQLATWLAELNRYKDLAEQSRLIELPCKPFEKVWVAHPKFSIHQTMFCCNTHILETMEAGYVIGYTEEEAEAKLKK